MDWQPLLANLTRLKETWPAPPWEWDGRFSAISAAFAIEQEPTVRASAMLAFPRGWTAKSLETAPQAFRDLADRTGGLRARQRLLGGDELSAPTLYGLWWPWGGGDRITLRIGILGADGKTEPMLAIRALFDVR